MGATNKPAFSVLRICVVGVVTTTAMIAATTLLAASLENSHQEDKRSVILNSARRALGIMSHEIQNSGYGLTDNGIVVADSSSNSIRVRANLNNNETISESGEDVRFSHSADSQVVVRFENCSEGASSTSILANNIEAFKLSYWDENGKLISDPSNYKAARSIGIRLRVSLPADSNEPASSTDLNTTVRLTHAPEKLETR